MEFSTSSFFLLLSPTPHFKIASKLHGLTRASGHCLASGHCTSLPHLAQLSTLSRKARPLLVSLTLHSPAIGGPLSTLQLAL